MSQENVETKSEKCEVTQVWPEIKDKSIGSTGSFRVFLAHICANLQEN